MRHSLFDKMTLAFFLLPVRPENTVSSPTPEPIRIWIVEDEILIAHALEQALGNLGHTITHIVPEDAAKLNLLALPRPDLALVDLDPSGDKDRASRIAVARWLKQHSAVPTIFVSSHLDDSVLRAADTVEPFGYLHKPVTERELKLTIDLASRRARAERALEDLTTVLLAQDAKKQYRSLAKRLKTDALRRLFNRKRLELPLVNKKGKKVPVQGTFFSIRQNFEPHLSAFLTPVAAAPVAEKRHARRPREAGLKAPGR